MAESFAAAPGLAIRRWSDASLESRGARGTLAFLRGAITILCSLACLVSAAGEGVVGASSQDEGAYETDRPGEVENPFTIAPGDAELVDYVVGLNATAREDEFGGNGSATVFDTAIRVGLANRVEAELAVDTLLDSGTASGVGFATVLAKWNFMRSDDGEFGLALAPFIRLPVNGAIGGTSSSEAGLAVPFDIDLEGGVELEGSASVTRAPEEPLGLGTQFEMQVSLQRGLTTRLGAYVELQLQSGDGPPEWAVESGVTCRLNPRCSLDLGGSEGVGRAPHALMAYAGMGWRF